MKNVFKWMLVSSIGVALTTHGATYYSTETGDFDDASTWGGHEVAAGNTYMATNRLEVRLADNLFPGDLVLNPGGSLWGKTVRDKTFTVGDSLTLNGGQVVVVKGSFSLNLNDKTLTVGSGTLNANEYPMQITNGVLAGSGTIGVTADNTTGTVGFVNVDMTEFTGAFNLAKATFVLPEIPTASFGLGIISGVYSNAASIALRHLVIDGISIPERDTAYTRADLLQIAADNGKNWDTLIADGGGTIMVPFPVIPVKPVRTAVLLTSDGAWSGTGVIGSSNDGRQTNSNSGGAFGNWGGASFNTGSETQYLDMQATASNVQQVYTEGYTYSVQASAAAALESQQDRQVVYLLADGNKIAASRSAGLNYTGTFGSKYRNTIYGYRTIEPGDSVIGKTIGMRLCSEGAQSRFRADGDSALSVRLTSHAGFNGNGVLYETSFETNAAGLVESDFVLHLEFDGTGTFGADSGEDCYILQASTESAESCSIATDGDTFRHGTTYEVSFKARCTKWDDASQIAVSVGSFTTNIWVGTTLSECSLTLDAEDAGIRGEALQVGLTPATTGAGMNEYRIRSLRLSAVSRTIGRWVEDNNQGSAGGIPPDFFSRLETNNLASWETSREIMDVYYLRSNSYNKHLKTNSVVKTRMAELFNQHGIQLALDDTAATWGHYRNDYNTPDYQGSINTLQDLEDHGFELCAVGLQSVLSKPTGDGTPYAMSWRILDIVEYIRQVKPHFPELEYGVIDAMPAKGWSYKTEYSDLKNAAENAGYTLDFIEQDFPIDFAITGSRTYADLVEAERFSRSALGLASGLYLTSSRGGQTSDELWRSDVLTGLEGYLTAGAAPERITLAAWYPHPSYSTPDETNPAANPNGATMLGTFLLSDEILNDHGFSNQTDTVSISVGSDAPGGMMMDFSGAASNDLVVRWNVLTGREYNLYSTTNLTSEWTPLSEGMSYPLNSYLDSGVLTNKSVFYKMENVSP